MRPAHSMGTNELKTEFASLKAEWKAFRAALDEEGGMAGSPGEWMWERLGEIETELERRGVQP